jgi:alpha-1,3-rhamnosyl/mannosyltransferase
MTTVLADGHYLEGASRFRGFGRYHSAVLEQLATHTDLEISALVTDAASVPEGIRAAVVSRIEPGRFTELEHELRLPLDIARHSSDVFHSPGNSPPLRCRRPWVQTLHDLIPLTFDFPGFKDERRRWRRRGGRIRDAAAVIANSQFTADEGIRRLGLDHRRVHVAPLGVDARFAPPPTRQRSAEPYLLYVGEYGPHKGYAEAFAAIGALADLGRPHRLKMVSRIAPWFEATVNALVAASPHPDRVERLGWVDDDALVGLYHGADALIVTSRAEGFGLPALEGMASGTPVISFRNTALVEVVEGGGVLVDDGDVRELVRVVDGVIADERRYAEVSASGVAKAAQFSWRACADVHAEVFRTVA